MTKLEMRLILGLGLISFFRMLGMFMILPTLSTYGFYLHHANKIFIGIAIGAYGLTQAIFQIPFGIISDKIGRKPIIIFGLLFLFIGSIVSAISNSIWGIIIGRAIQGSGAISAPIMALLSDFIKKNNQTKATAFIGFSFGLSFATAMVFAPFLSNNFGFHSIFWVTAILAILSMIIIKIVIPNENIKIKKRYKKFVFFKENFNFVIKNQNLLKVNLSTLFLNILLMFCFVDLPKHLNKLNIFLLNINIYLFLILFAFVGTILYCIYFDKKYKKKNNLIFSITLMLFSEVFLSQYFYLNKNWLLILGLQMFFCSFNIISIILPSLMNKFSKNYKGTANGLYLSSQFLGMGIGGSIGGLVSQYCSNEKIFFLGICLCILWLKKVLSKDFLID